MRREIAVGLAATLLLQLGAAGCQGLDKGKDTNNISPFAWKFATPEEVERRRQLEDAAAKAVPLRVVDVKAESEEGKKHYAVLLEATNLTDRPLKSFTVKFEFIDASSHRITGSEGRVVTLNDSLKPGEKGQAVFEQVLTPDEHSRFAHVTVSCTSY